MPPENDQQVVTDIGDAELEQWLTSIGDGVDVNLPGLDIGIPISSRKVEPAPQEINAPIAQQGGPDDDDDDDDDEDDDDLPGGDPSAQQQRTPDHPATPAAPDASEGEFFTVNGNQVAKADVQRLYEFDQWLRANPDAAARVQAAIPAPTTPAGGPPAVPPAPEQASAVEFEAPTPPEFLDMEDPRDKFQWDTHVASLKTTFDRDQRDKQLFAQTQQIRQESVTRQAAADMTTALGQFKQSHPNLNEDDIASIRKAAAPFLTGMMQQLAPVEALVRSMEVGGMMDDDLRSKLMDTSVRTPTEKTKTRHRKERLGALSGSARSAPKTENRPVLTSDKDLINALAQEFSESMQR
jgi:hypothetical protein